MGNLTAIHEDILIAHERANASFEKGNLLVEIFRRGWCPPPNRRDAVREKYFFGINHMLGVTGAIGYSDEGTGGCASPTYQWEKEHDRWARSLVEVSGSMNM